MSFENGIKVASGFSVGSQQPVDARTTFKTLEDMNNLSNSYRYLGLICYVEETNSYYALKNDMTIWEDYDLSLYYTKEEIDDMDKVSQDGFDEHISDEIIHVTQEDRDSWDAKADLIYVDEELAKKADLIYVDEQLDLKSDLEYVDEQLALKSDITYVDDELAKKANIEDIPDVSNKLESSNIIAGDNISVEVVDNDVTISVTGLEDFVTELDYENILNKPSINDVELDGNKTLDDLNIQVKGDYATNEDLNKKIAADNIVAGDNVTVEIQEGNVVISSKFEEGTVDYVELINKPSIGGVELNGDVTLDDLGIQAKGDYADSTYVNEELDKKVDKVDGMGLSSNDFTDEYVAKLDTLENYTLPIGSATELGGFKVGNNLTVDEDGFLHAQAGGGGGDGEGGVSTWELLQNKPFETVDNVKLVVADGKLTIADDFVADGHTHDNKSTLDKLSESMGNLMFDGMPIVSGEGGSCTVIRNRRKIIIDTNNQTVLNTRVKTDKTISEIIISLIVNGSEYIENVTPSIVDGEIILTWDSTGVFELDTTDIVYMYYTETLCDNGGSTSGDISYGNTSW